MAVQAPAAHRASCSMGPPHHIERIRTTHARAVGEPSRAISVLKYVTVIFFYFSFLALILKYYMLSGATQHCAFSSLPEQVNENIRKKHN